MSGTSTSHTPTGKRPLSPTASARVPEALEGIAWALWLVSLGALAAHVWGAGLGAIAGLVIVDGLAVTMWTVVTFFAAIVTRYARRYMAGNDGRTRFLATVLGFTLVVGTLAAADHVVLFTAAWLAMGLAMAELIGHARSWPQAREAAATARRSFLASSAFVALGLAVLAWSTGVWTVSGIVAAETIPRSVWLLAVGSLVLAAAIQCALLPFHTWLVSSMTAPTPASALMHAGFVNAGGFLLARIAPLLVLDPWLMLAVTTLGATSALVGKLMRTVANDVKSRLGSSTVGQMGFMIMQAGLGLFAAAITHLILHGFYKAYRFLSAGERVQQEPPADAPELGKTTPVGVLVTLATGVAGGATFVLLTGKGWSLDAGLLLMGLVVLASLHGTREVVRHVRAPKPHRYGLTFVLALVAITTYAAVYGAVRTLMGDLPVSSAPVDLTAAHAVLAAGFLAIYLATETQIHHRSRRLYVWLLNAARPKPETILASTEDYRDH